MLGVLDNHENKMMLPGVLVLKEPVKLVVFSEGVSWELTRLGLDLLDLVALAGWPETDDLDLAFISQEEVFLTETNVLDCTRNKLARLRKDMWKDGWFGWNQWLLTWVIIEDVLDLGDIDGVVVELDDVEPAAAILSLIEFEDEVVEENVPAHDIVYRK